ncbi:MAG: ABC transporter substrate-binding protein [Spirochaetaceae bacterium]|nr:ABC transporter substrate-binding protein [Spirochaetaceae bacterium]
MNLDLTHLVMLRTTPIKIATIASFLLCGVLLHAGGGSDCGKGCKVPPCRRCPCSTCVESPLLSAIHAYGGIPSVADRMPDDPFVMEGVGGGTYGGTIRLGQIERMESFPYIEGVPMAVRDLTSKRLTPALLQDWTLSDDRKTLAFHVRRGTRWSDGEPFTTEDIAFAYSDVLNNEHLTPLRPQIWEGSSMNIISPEIVEFTFDRPANILFDFYGIDNRYLQDSRQAPLYLARHHASRFHSSYNVDAVDEAKAAGFPDWPQYFHYQVSHPGSLSETNLVPSVNPWMPLTADDTHVRSVRNPFFWAVDSDGRQLPYVDVIVSLKLGDTSSMLDKAIAGEIDWVCPSSSEIRELESSIASQITNPGISNIEAWAAPFMAQSGGQLGDSLSKQDDQHSRLNALVIEGQLDGDGVEGCLRWFAEPFTWYYK